MLRQSSVKVTFSITQNDWRGFSRFSWGVLVQWQKLPPLYLHWYSAFWRVLRTKLCQAAVSCRPVDHVCRGLDGQWQPVKCLSNAAFVSTYLDMFFEWLEGTIQYPFGLSIVLVCMWTIHSEGGELCMNTTAKAEIVLCYSWVGAVGERVIWLQLLSIFLPEPLWTCCAPCHLSLTIFPFCSLQVSADTSAT